MPSTYPEAADLTAALTALGVTEPTASATILDGAIAYWERVTGHNPFLATGTESEKTFDPPYNDRGFVLDIPACVSVESVTVDESALTVTDDYDLLPLNGTPKNGIRMKSHPGFKQASVVVSADWGYSSTVPSDVWTAILNLAVAECSLQSASAAEFSAEKIRQDKVEIQYGSGASRVESARKALDNLAWQFKAF